MVAGGSQLWGFILHTVGSKGAFQGGWLSGALSTWGAASVCGAPSATAASMTAPRSSGVVVSLLHAAVASANPKENNVQPLVLIIASSSSGRAAGCSDQSPR